MSGLPKSRSHRQTIHGFASNDDAESQRLNSHFSALLASSDDNDSSTSSTTGAMSISTPNSDGTSKHVSIIVAGDGSSSPSRSESQKKKKKKKKSQSQISADLPPCVSVEQATDSSDANSEWRTHAMHCERVCERRPRKSSLLLCAGPTAPPKPHLSSHSTAYFAFICMSCVWLALFARRIRHFRVLVPATRHRSERCDAFAHVDALAALATHRHQCRALLAESSSDVVT
jgi:hypothetical protein